MDDTDKQDIAAMVVRMLRAPDQAEPTTTTTGIVPFKDAGTENIAHHVYAYMQAHPDATSAEIVKELSLPTHWFRNPKALANGKRITPTLGLMRERAGARVRPEAYGPKATHKKATPKAALRATPEEAQARRAVAVRVAEHFEHALDDGLASGLLYEKAKSTRTIRSLVAQVRLRGGVTQ